MSYIEDNLLTEEKLVYRTRLHWIEFLPVLSAALVPALFGSALLVIPERSESLIPFLALLFLFPAIVGLYKWIEYKSSEFGITNKRIVVKMGFIKRETIELLLQKVETIQVHQSILGRILGYGSIIISGTGGINSPFHKIDNPLQFRKLAHEQIIATKEV